MLRTLFLLTLLSGLLFSASNFTVRIAIFQNSDRLQKAINRFSPALRKTVRTYKKGKLTYAYTLPTKDKKILKKLLPSYHKVFSDAYITPTKKNKMKRQF